MDSDRWIPWEKGKEDIWVRNMPDVPYLITEDNVPFDITVGQRDYDVQDNFCKWFAEKKWNYSNDYRNQSSRVT